MKTGLIVTGTNSVEVDRVVTKIMGIDPESIALIKEAQARGFGDPNAQIIGNLRTVPFRKAESSFLTPRFRKIWPNVRYFVGHTNSRAPKVTDIHAVSPALVYEIEGACRGGCLATMAFFMEMLYQGKITYDPSTKFAVILGNGCEVGTERYWFDADGNPYTLTDLKQIGMKKVLGCGTCTKPAFAACSCCGGDCGNVGGVLQLFMKGTGKIIPILSIHNDSFLDFIIGMIRKYIAVRKVIKQGDIVEIPFDATDDRVFPIPELTEEERRKDWIFVPMEKCTLAQIKKNLKAYEMIQMG